MLKKFQKKQRNQTDSSFLGQTLKTALIRVAIGTERNSTQNPQIHPKNNRERIIKKKLQEKDLRLDSLK